MQRLAPVLALISVLALPGAAAAQLDDDPRCSSGGENPLGIAMGFAAYLPALLSLPVTATDGALPRPGLGLGHVALGWQGGPDAFAAAGDSGGYFGDAPALGLESRFSSRMACTGADLGADGAYYALLRPTPAHWPVWLELLGGASFDAVFGSQTTPYATGGPAGGARLGLSIPMSMRGDLVLEGEGLYHARWSTAYEGARHRFEMTARVGLIFAPGEEGIGGGPVLEYRRETALEPHPALPQTHRITVGGVMSF